MFRRMTGSAVVIVLTGFAFSACGGGPANEARPGETTPGSTAPATTSAAPVFDPPKAFAEEDVRITQDEDAVVGPELAYTTMAEGEEHTGPTEPTVTVHAISLADGTERWTAPTPIEHRIGSGADLRLAAGPGPLRLVWAGVHRLDGSGTQQDRFELAVGTIDASTGRPAWSLALPLTGDNAEDTEVTIVGADDAHVVVAASQPIDAPISGAVVDVRAGTITATPPEFRPIGLDGQTVVGLRSTGGLSVVAEGIDIATGQPRWTGNVRVEDLYAAVVTAGLAHFVEDDLHNSTSLLVNTADGTVRAKLPDSEECSAAAPDVVVCVGFDHVTALDPAGTVLWSLPDEAAGRIRPAVTAVHSGLVYGNANGGVILDARTGKDLATLDSVPDDVVPGYGIYRSDVDGLSSRRATG